ncbi:MAG: vitamin K epoxide reductase family protein [Patescibacteria group bacterium]|nr:vitamin K epoxide reductase family protein [Patescibacteria group bacterium]
MHHLKQLWTRRLHQVPVSLIIVVLAVAIIGFADAGYLSIEHFKDVIPPCSITGGCEKVLTSQFAVILGIPVSLLGAAYYFSICCGLFAFLESRNHEVLRVTLLLTILGFLASLWFVFLQAFVIHSYCAYCLGSAATSTVLFILAAVILGRYKEPASI